MEALCLTTLITPRIRGVGGVSMRLYFAYTALISPRRMGKAVPEARFSFIAHLPETRLVFPYSNGTWEGGLPSILAEPGSTFCGAGSWVHAKQAEELNAGG